MPSAAIAVMIRNDETCATTVWTSSGTMPTELSAARAGSRTGTPVGRAVHRRRFTAVRDPPGDDRDGRQQAGDAQQLGDDGDGEDLRAEGLAGAGDLRHVVDGAAEEHTHLEQREAEQVVQGGIDHHHHRADEVHAHHREGEIAVGILVTGQTAEVAIAAAAPHTPVAQPVRRPKSRDRPTDATPTPKGMVKPTARGRPPRAAHRRGPGGPG